MIHLPMARDTRVSSVTRLFVTLALKWEATLGLLSCEATAVSELQVLLNSPV